MLTLASHSFYYLHISREPVASSINLWDNCSEPVASTSPSLVMHYNGMFAMKPMSAYRVHVSREPVASTMPSTVELYHNQSAAILAQPGFILSLDIKFTEMFVSFHNNKVAND